LAAVGQGLTDKTLEYSASEDEIVKMLPAAMRRYQKT
jgi:hypothetical protein